MASGDGPKKVLFLTNCERGQSTVVLATSHALLSLGNDEDVEVHIASFEALEREVRRASDYALSQGARRPIVFHRIGGLDMGQAWKRKLMGGTDPGVIQIPRLWWNMPAKFRILFRVMQPWTPEEFLVVYDSLLDIVREVGADIVAVDNVLPQALTACRFLGVKMIILSPNTIKDFALPFQPYAAALWKFPCVGTAFPYPVPLYLIPINFILVCIIIYMTITDAHTRELREAVEAHSPGAKYTTLTTLAVSKDLNFKVLVANLPELEFPLAFIPGHLVPCGPILRPARPCADASPDLAAWIAQGPTIYINLGSHVVLHVYNALQMAGALRKVLDRASGPDGHDRKLDRLQVLWKLVKYKGEDGSLDYAVDEPGCAIHQVLGNYMDSGRIKIVEWIEPEPIAVLEQPNVVLAVHHGGANSFLEAVSAGVPHVVLGVWMDTYDFANRAECLGIGIWGNKTAKPNCQEDELGRALVDILMGPRSTQMKQKAAELARLCAENGGGRMVAARTILEEIAAARKKQEDEEQATEGDQQQGESAAPRDSG